MSAVLRVLTWEFLRRIMTSLPLTLPWIVLGPLGVEGLFWLADLSPEDDMLPTMHWHPIYLALGFFLMATPVCEALKGIRRRLFVLPVSNRFIVGWLMSSAMSIILLQELIAHWLCTVLLSKWAQNAIFGDITWLFGPTQPVFAAATMMGITMFWNMEFFRFRKLVLYFAILMVYGWWVGSHYFPNGYHGEPHAWRTLSLLDSGVFVLIGITSWIVAVRSLSRERAGDSACETFDARFQVICDRIVSILFRDDRLAFTTPTEAIRWHEWRGSGREVVLICGACIGGFVGVFLYFMMTRQNRFDIEGAFVITTVFTSMEGFIVGLASTMWNEKNNNLKMRPFMATVPMSDASLSRALLRNKVRTTLWSWAIVLIPFLISLGTAHVTGQLKAQFYADVSIGALDIKIPAVIALIGLTPVTLLFAWIVCGCFSCLLWTGNRMLWSFVMGTICFAVVLFMMTRSFLLPDDLVPVFEKATAATIAAVIVLSGLVAFAAAWKRELIFQSVAVNGAIFWAILSIVCWNLLPSDPFFRTCVCASLILAVVPFAAGPLAIARNRHAV